MNDPFSSLIGNEEVKKVLKRLAHRNIAGTVFLFCGPKGVGKGEFAKAFAHHILGGTLPHPDLREYKPLAKMGMHPIDTIRCFTEEVYLAPYNSPVKIFILHDADRMLVFGANALLKTLEEPPSDTIIILVASSKEALLPTILSRCCSILFRPIPEEEIIRFLKHPDKVFLAKRAQGSLGKALSLAQQETSSEQNSFYDLLSKGTFPSYGVLLDCAKMFAEAIEQKVSLFEKELQDELPSLEGSHPADKDAREQEMLGLVALKRGEEIDKVLEGILTWYRDLHLLSVNGDPKYLFHFDREKILLERIQRGNIPSIASIAKEIEEVKKGLSRASPLLSSLERLFLQMEILEKNDQR